MSLPSVLFYLLSFSIALGMLGCASSVDLTADEVRVEVTTTAPWVDSTRCFHVDHDEHVVLHPRSRFETANDILQAWRDSMIGERSYCCQDSPQEWTDNRWGDQYCDHEGWYWEWAESNWFWADIMPTSPDIISLYLGVGKNRGGSRVWRIAKPLTVHTATGHVITPPDTLQTLSIVALRDSIRSEFNRLNLGQSELGSGVFSDLSMVEEIFMRRLTDNPFVVRNGEWHWLLTGAPDLYNAAQTVWTIPTGVAFEP